MFTAAVPTEVVSYGDLLGALRDYQPGDTATLTAVRDGDESEFEVEPAERPQ